MLAEVVIFTGTLSARPDAFGRCVPGFPRGVRSATVTACGSLRGDHRCRKKVYEAIFSKLIPLVWSKQVLTDVQRVLYWSQAAKGAVWSAAKGTMSCIDARSGESMSKLDI